jgi:hypothetical protein
VDDTVDVPTMIRVMTRYRTLRRQVLFLDRKDIHVQEERQQSILEIHNHDFPPHLLLPDLLVPTDIPDFLDGKEINLRAASSGLTASLLILLLVSPASYTVQCEYRLRLRRCMRDRIRAALRMTNARAASVIPTPMPIREGFNEAAETVVEEPGFVTVELSMEVPNPAVDITVCPVVSAALQDQVVDPIVSGVRGSSLDLRYVDVTTAVDAVDSVPIGSVTCTIAVVPAIVVALAGMIIAIRVDAVVSVPVSIGSVSGINTVVPAIVVVLAGIIVTVPRLADSVESTKYLGLSCTKRKHS